MKKKTYNPSKKTTYKIDCDTNGKEIVDYINNEGLDKLNTWRDVRDYFRSHLFLKLILCKDGEIIKEQTADCSKLQLKFKGNKVYLGSKGARKIKYFYLARTD